MRCSPIVELRQYTLLPERRDELIELFEAEFVESQERCGTTIIGTFRDLDDPAMFVWLRGFASMADRARMLREFYWGPVWKRHGQAANATTVDTDDVLLLRPPSRDDAFALPAGRPALGAGVRSDRATLSATVLHLDRPADDSMLQRLRDERSARGIAALATFVTCDAENDVPELPVREGEHVVVWFERAPDASAGPREIDLSWAPLARAPQLLALAPTQRSLLTGDVSPAPASAGAAGGER